MASAQSQATLWEQDVPQCPLNRHFRRPPGGGQPCPISPEEGLLKKLFIFRVRGREGEREGEKHQCVVASHTPPIGDLTCNPGICFDWELNRRPFGSQVSTQSTEPHQPGLEEGS